MELVKGVPITEFCDQHHLTPEQRLKLLIPVCQAVQHAHQKGIIHRDLKPSNILVVMHDTTPVPKVIDVYPRADKRRLSLRELAASQYREYTPRCQQIAMSVRGRYALMHVRRHPHPVLD